VRILVFSHYFWPENFRINELVAELTRRGHLVTVVTGKPNYPSGRLDPAFVADPAAFSMYEGARVIRVPIIRRGTTLRLILNYLSYAVSATAAVFARLGRERFDVVLVYAPSPFTVGVPGTVFRWWRRRPIVFWVHDQWPETLKAVGAVSSERALKWVGKFVAFTFERCDLILAQSKGLVPVIRQYCRPAKRVEYLPNWAESRFQDGPAAPAPEVPPAPPGAFTVMFAGNIGVSQDMPAVIAAAGELADLPNIRWLIVGDGRAAEDAKAEVTRRGLERTVTFLGRHSADRMPSFYAHADALLASLRAEPVFAMTVPGKVQSYLMAGVPVLAMLDGEGAKVIDEAGGGLTGPAGDSAALARNVRRLAGMTGAERRAMGARGRAYAIREFDFGTVVDRLEGWLTELASRA